MPLASGGGAETTTLLIELGAILFVLGAIGRVAKAVRVPVIPLYLLAGLFFGQGGFVSLSASNDFLTVAAEIGVILLLVMLGLEYSATELVASVRTQAPLGLLDGVLNAAPGAVVALALGWGGIAALALAGVTWVSSSGVIAKMLGDSGRLGNREVPAILAIIVLEDLMMAMYLPLLTAVLAPGSAATVIVTVLAATGTVALIIVLVLRYGQHLSSLFSAKDPESLLLGVLGLTLLVAGLADELKVSAAVGAFLVGIALSGTIADTAAELLAPLRDVFAAAFFVTFGLSTDAGSLWPMLPVALILLVVTSATKITTGYVAARRDGVKRRGRWRAGVTLVPRGEFSVVIATLAVSAGVEPKLAPLTACYVLLTIGLAAAIQTLPDRLLAESTRTRGPRPDARSRHQFDQPPG